MCTRARARAHVRVSHIRFCNHFLQHFSSISVSVGARLPVYGGIVSINGFTRVPVGAVNATLLPSHRHELCVCCRRGHVTCETGPRWSRRILQVSSSMRAGSGFSARKTTGNRLSTDFNSPNHPSGPYLNRVTARTVAVHLMSSTLVNK